MKTEYYIGTNEVSKEVYDTVQVYKKHNLLLTYENDKYKKALEIIKKKRVDVGLVFYTNNADMYNLSKQFYNKKLTKKEYKLLKEILK